jgi:Mrp family chromosome partitioning ATPase
MAELLAWAETEYDQILIDCPPVLVASDAILIGKIVDGSVLVVRPDKNRRRIVYRATESLTGMGIHLFGIVTNCINMASGKIYSFGHSEGYGYDYDYGHSEEEDIEDAYVAIDFEIQPDTAEVSQDSQHMKPTTPRRAA